MNLGAFGDMDSFGNQLAQASWDPNVSPEQWLKLYDELAAKAETEEEKAAIADQAELAYRFRTMSSESKKVTRATAT